MNTPAVQELCAKVWHARAVGELTRDAGQLSRLLYEAIWRDLTEHREVAYDPEDDRRVAWVRELVAALRRRPTLPPRAALTLEDVVGWMLCGCQEERTISGKERAAGERTEP